MAKNKDFIEKQIKYFDSQASKIGNLEETQAGQFEFGVVLSYLDLPAGKKILELGCGTGRYSLKFLERGYDVFGVDISPLSLKKLQKLYERRKEKGWGRLEVGDKLPDKGEFDACVCINVLHHVEDLEEVLLKVKRLLGKKGKILIFEPNPFCPAWYIMFLLNGILKIEKNITKSSLPNLKKMLVRTGYVNIESNPYGLIPTRLISWPHLLKLSSITLAKTPLIRFFSFHNMVRAEVK